LQLCRDAREAVKTTDAERRQEELQRYTHHIVQILKLLIEGSTARLIQLANAYIQGVCRKDKSNEPSWSYTVGELNNTALKLCGDIEMLVHDAEQADSEAENEKKKTTEKIKAVGFSSTSVLRRSP